MGNWNRHFVRVGSDGNVGWYDPKGNLIFEGYLQPTSGGVIGQGVPLISFNDGAQTLVYPHGFANNNNTNNVFTFYNEGYLSQIRALSSITAMNGVPGLTGNPDLRTGVTAADASAITIYSSTNGGTRYEVKARILATAGSSATYTISWTEGGVAQKVALTITAVDTEVHDNFVIAPDSGTDITAQITALTSSTVNVDAIVSVLG